MISTENDILQISPIDERIPRSNMLINRDWKFLKGSRPGAEAIDFDDSSWKSCESNGKLSLLLVAASFAKRQKQNKCPLMLDMINFPTNTWTYFKMEIS